MTSIIRNPETASREKYDVIIVGGGIYGICTALEAARRGLSPMLLEKHDFGGATSWNSLRIIHGGLRYLQNCDLKRFYQSVKERAWFLSCFPDCVEPLPCVMPLYNRGFRRTNVLRIALAANDYLSDRLTRSMPGSQRLAPCRILSVDETIQRFPLVDQCGLRGAALWYDARMTRPQRLIIEMLRWACRCGAQALNYLQATDVSIENNRVVGLSAIDRLTKQKHHFRAPLIINCAGPWVKELASNWDARTARELFQPILAFNVCFDRPALADEALAVTSPGRDKRSWFLTSLQGRLFAGTDYVSCREKIRDQPHEHELERFVESINLAVPQLNLSANDVLRVYAGLLPSGHLGSRDPEKNPRIWHHGLQGGPTGLVSVIGVKYTTARAIAERTLREIFSNYELHTTRDQSVRYPDRSDASDYLEDVNLADASSAESADADKLQHWLMRCVRDESATCAEDILYRRTDWGCDPRTVDSLIKRISAVMNRIDLDAERRK